MPKTSKRKAKQIKRRTQKRADRLADEAERRPPAEKLLDRIARERRQRHARP